MGIRTRETSHVVSSRSKDEEENLSRHDFSLPHVMPAVDTPEVSPCHHLQVLAWSPFLFQLSSKLLSVGSSVLLSRCFGLPSEILAIALFYLPTLQSTSLFVLREAARRTAFRIPPSKAKKDSSSELGEFLVKRGREKEEEEEDRNEIKRSVGILHPLDSPPLIKKRYLSSPARLHSYSRHHTEEFDSLEARVGSPEATKHHEGQKEDLSQHPTSSPDYKTTEDQGEQITCLSQRGLPDRSLPSRLLLPIPPSVERPSLYDLKSSLSSSSLLPSLRSSFVPPSRIDSFSRDESLRSSLNLSYLGFLFSSFLVLVLGMIWLSVHPTYEAERESRTSEGLLSKTSTTGGSPHEELEAYAFLWSYRIAVFLFVLATLLEASCEPLLISLLLAPSSSCNQSLPKDFSSLSDDPGLKETSFFKEKEEQDKRSVLATEREQIFSSGGAPFCASDEEASLSRGELLCWNTRHKAEKTGDEETARDEEKENKQMKSSGALRTGEREKSKEEEEEENDRCVDRTTKRASTYRAMAEAAAVTSRLLCILALITLQHFLKTSLLFTSVQEEEKTFVHLDRREEGESHEDGEAKSFDSANPLCSYQDSTSSSSSASLSSFPPLCSSTTSSSKRLFRSSKLADDSSFTSCRGQEEEFHPGVHTLHSSCVHTVSPLLASQEEPSVFSSESWLMAVGKLLAVQPLLAFGIAQVMYSLVWMFVLSRASRDLYREEDRGKKRETADSSDLSFHQHFRNIQGRKDYKLTPRRTGEAVSRGAEMKEKDEKEEEGSAYEKTLKRESFLMYILQFHRKAFDSFYRDLRGSREFITGEKRKEPEGGEKTKRFHMESFLSLFRQLISFSVSFFSFCCSSLLASLFSFPYACGHHAPPRGRSSSSSSLWDDTSSSTKDESQFRSSFFFSSSRLFFLHSPSLDLPGMRRSSSERRLPYCLDSRGTLPLSNPSRSLQRKKEGRSLFSRGSHANALPLRIDAEIARVERRLLAEEHRRLLRVNLGVMAQKFVATEGEKFLLLSLLDSKAAGEYVFVSSAASILCRLLFTPIEEEAFNAFCSTRQLETPEREKVMERDVQSLSSFEKDEEEKAKEKKSEIMMAGPCARSGDSMAKVRSIEEKERLKGEEEEEDYEKISSLGRQERQSVDQDRNTRMMKEPMLVYDVRALEREREKKQGEGRSESVRNRVERAGRQEGDDTCLYTEGRPAVDDVRKDGEEVYVHPGVSSLIMCREGNGGQDALRCRKPRGEEGGKSSMELKFSILQVDSQSHRAVDPAFLRDRRTTTTRLQERKADQRYAHEEQQQQQHRTFPQEHHHPLSTFNRNDEAMPGSPRAVRTDSSLPPSSGSADGRQIRTVYSRAERGRSSDTFPATSHKSSDRGSERSSADTSGFSMKSQSSLVWIKSLPILRLLLLIEGTIGLVAATQGPIFARAALRLVYGPRWGNEPGAVAALQV